MKRGTIYFTDDNNKEVIMAELPEGTRLTPELVDEIFYNFEVNKYERLDPGQVAVILGRSLDETIH